jgi:fumarate reductase flavoprotein subunit
MDTIKSDIIIMGAGTAGLAAAIEAAEHGAKVIIFEKASTTGGTGNMGMGPLGVESRLQRLKNVLLTKEQAFKIFMDFTHWRVDAALVSAYINKSGDTINWLEEMGVEFADVASYFRGSEFTHHQVKGATGGPGPMATAAMMKCMTDRANELGVKIYLNTPIRKLIKENNKVVGVIAEGKDGQIEARSKAVIIATGGFGDNVEMMKKYTGYEWGKNIFSMRIPGVIGEGIRIAWEAGAAEEGLNMELIYGLQGMTGGSMSNEGMTQMLQLMAANYAFQQPGLMVNLPGERFMNEEIIGAWTFTANAIARQKDSCGFMIMDETKKNQFVTKSLDIGTSPMPVDRVENLDEVINICAGMSNPVIFKANSIEELAKKAGINAATLKETVEQYNKFCEAGRDTVFHKDPKFLSSVKTAPFYAGRHAPAAYGSLGGIKISHRTEAIDKDFNPIPGLYAAGTDACSLYADSYVFVLGGNTMGFALNSGRIAGENAAKYAKSQPK